MGNFLAVPRADTAPPAKTTPPPRPLAFRDRIRTECFPDEQLGVACAQTSQVREADELRQRFPPMVAYRAGKVQNAVLITDNNRLGVFQ